MRPIVPSLWFNGGLEEAVAFYTAVFPDSTVGDALRMPDGTLVTIDFTLAGQQFNLIDGGPDHLFPFSEAVSFIVRCEDEAEVDHYWDALLSGGGTESQCGWLKDRYGLSWQVVPVEFEELARSDDLEAVARLMGARRQMIKLDMPALRSAFAGEPAARG
jgi:predicted 3-demethylubiquinone-9 3-methyltransferase (glyoxalase superfamily)